MQRFEAQPTEIEKYYGDSPLFLTAPAAQEELSEIVYDSIEEAHEVARDMAAELDQVASVQQVMGRMALMRGSPLVVPRPLMSVEDGLMSVTYAVDEYDQNNPLYVPQEHGLFYGFAGRPVPVKDGDDEVVGYTAEIGYALTVAPGIETPVFSGNLTAYGPVATTELLFDDDKRHRTVEAALEKLHNLRAETSQYHLHNIMSILSGDEEDLMSYRQAARLARALYNDERGQMTQQEMDAVLELFEAHFPAGYGDKMALRVKSAYSTEEDGTPLVYAPIEGVATVRSLTWMPYYYIHDGQLKVDRTQSTIGVAVDGESLDGTDGVVYVPLEKLLESRA